MLTATAFACIRAQHMAVRRIQLTQELKALLVFLRFAGLGNEPLDVEPMEGEKTFDGLEQRLQLIHAASAKLVFPSLPALQKASKGTIDATFSLRAVGISIHESVQPLTNAATRDYWNDLDASVQALDRLAYVADQLSRFREKVTRNEFSQNNVADAPLLFLDDLDDLLEPKGRSVIKIVSANKIRVLLLLEPQAAASEGRLRVYGPAGPA